MAVPVTCEFTGVVDNFNNSGEDIFLPSPIPFGTAFSGRFVIEDSTPAYSQDTGYVSYRGLVTGAELSFGPGGSAGLYEFADLGFRRRLA
jgi:hypothetical protein